MKIVNRLLPLLLLCILCACSSRNNSDKSDSVVSMQIIDRNGFTETISNKERISSFDTTDFLTPQPYQKVLRVFGRNAEGQSTSKITSYHENGSLWQYLEVTDGRAHGLYREWFASGKKKIEAHLIEGVADIHDLAQATWVFEGECNVWDEQENPVAEFHYEKGLLHADARYYFPNGKLMKNIPYTQGEIDGIAQTFDQEGNLIEEIPYQKGEKNGTALCYWGPDRLLSTETFEKGRLFKAAYFDAKGVRVAEVNAGTGKQAQFKDDSLYALYSIANGLVEGEMQFFYPNGALQCSYMIKEDKKHGGEWEYYPSENTTSPQPRLHLNWNHDAIQGHAKTWYENGQMESQREIHNNKKQGSAYAWYKNGDVMLIEEYENDLLVKGVYYKKGDKKPVSKIDAGKGTATLYSGEGIFVRKATYEKGKPLLAGDTVH